MVIEKILNGVEHNIRIEIDNNLWARVFYDEKEYLGAEVIDIIVQKMLGALNRKLNEKTILIDNVECKRIITLSETYTTLFISNTDPNILFIVRNNQNLDKADRFQVSNEQVETWRNVIKQIKHTFWQYYEKQ